MIESTINSFKEVGSTEVQKKEEIAVGESETQRVFSL